MNNYFGKKYNVYFFDGETFQFKIKNITYSNIDGIFDITNKIINNSNDFTKFKGVNKNTDLSDICSLTNEKSFHYLTVNYIINNTQFKERYYLKDYILLDNIDFFDKLSNKKYINALINREHTCKDPNIFYDFLKNFHFNKKVELISNTYFDNLQICKSNINFIHLRLEDDYINVLKTQTSLDFNICKKILENKYIHNIKTYFLKKDLIIILAYDFNNNVISFLKDNDYNFITTINLDKNREICAAIDLSLGKYCNNNYIGYYQSTFSYTFYHRYFYNIKNTYWIELN
jgi:hypothetical protein